MISLTCDMIRRLFFREAQKFGSGRVSGQEKEEKERLTQLLHQLSAAPCLLMQSDFNKNEYILEGAKCQNSKNIFEHSILCYKQIYYFFYFFPNF